MFSYKDYEEIIHRYKSIIVDFSEVNNYQNFCLIRHDIEFDLSSSLPIAEIDMINNIPSSFLIQVRCNSYNILSIKNIKIINKLKSLDRKIGLHLYVPDNISSNDWEYVNNQIITQKNILENVIEEKVDRFSFHRPKKWILNNRSDNIQGLINMYGESFFEFNDNPKKIKYYADSRHRWSYGHPLNNINYNRLQILMHPDEWSKKGYNKNKNFKNLIKNNTESFKNTLFEETVYKNNER